VAAPIITSNLTQVRTHVGVGNRLGKDSIVDRHTSEPLQVITRAEPAHIAATLDLWDLQFEQEIQRRERDGK
jgi:hypothetical protein